MDESAIRKIRKRIPMNEMYTPFEEYSIDKYGRKLSKAHINKIIKNFDLDLLGEIIVCDVSEELRAKGLDASAPYEIVDANHRVHALRQLTSPTTPIEATIIPYVDKATRAKKYISYNKDRIRVSATDGFKAALVAGNQIEKEVWAIIRRHKVNIKGIHKQSWPYINGVKDVMDIYNKDKSPTGVLDKTFRVLIEAYKDSSSTWRERAFYRECLLMVAGFFLHTTETNQPVDRARVTRILESKKTVEWSGEFKLLYDSQASKPKWKNAGFQTLAAEYNKKLWDKNKLV